MSIETNQYLLYEMMSEEEFRPIFDELLKDGIIYVFELEGEPKGMFKLIPQEHRGRHICYLGGLAIDPGHHHKGLGYEMVKGIIKFATSKNFKRIELSTYVGNQRAIKLYEKEGFEHEGIMKKYTYLKSKDEYRDEVLMAYLM